jgi:hypothetical protein
MQRFEYRYPRFTVDFPARLSTANETLAGRCLNISTNGIRLDLAPAVLPGEYGTVALRHQDQTIQLKVRVAHTGHEHSGLEFLFDSAAERSIVTDLVNTLKNPHNRPVMTLVPKINASLGGPIARR